jgi:hypothetical protein
VAAGVGDNAPFTTGSDCVNQIGLETDEGSNPLKNCKTLRSSSLDLVASNVLATAP